MARPKAFDRDAALLRAIEVFADYGYGGTSVDTLRHAMGIGRQSFYDTFGAKQDLYLEALKRYNHDRSERIVSDLKDGATPVEGLERALLSFVDDELTTSSPACLGIGAICEFGASRRRCDGCRAGKQRSHRASGAGGDRKAKAAGHPIPASTRRPRCNCSVCILAPAQGSGARWCAGRCRSRCRIATAMKSAFADRPGRSGISGTLPVGVDGLLPLGSQCKQYGLVSVMDQALRREEPCR